MLIDKSTLMIEGRLTFHGVTKNIAAAFNEDQKIVKGDFSILLSDYKVEPSLLFVKMTIRSISITHLILNSKSHVNS